jgi:hypothetical protein
MKNKQKSIKENPDPGNQTKSMEKNGRNEKSRDFCSTFIKSTEDRRRNPGSRPKSIELKVSSSVL